MQLWKRVEKRRELWGHCFLHRQLFYAFSRMRFKSCCTIALKAQSDPFTAFSVCMLIPPMLTGAQYQLICLIGKKPEWADDKSISQQIKCCNVFFLTHQAKVEKCQVFTSSLFLFFWVIGRCLLWQRLFWSQKARKSLRSFWQRQLHSHSY